MNQKIADTFCLISEADRDKIIDLVAGKIIRYGLEAPAVFLLEMGKPLTFFGSQGVLMTGPFLGPFVGESRINKLSAFFEDRNNIELLIRKIEESATVKQEEPTA